MPSVPKEVLQLYSESQCAIAYDISILQVRKAKARYGIALEQPLCREGLLEIYYTQTDHTLQWIMAAYEIDLNQAVKGRYRRPKAKAYTTPKAEDLIPWLATGLSYDTIADALGCSHRYVHKVAKEHKHLFPSKRPSKLTVEEQQQIVSALVNKTKTQIELAEDFKLSQATISKLNPNKQTRKQYNRLSKEQWDELLKELSNGETPSALSRKYNVARNAIYQKQKSKDNG